ncbi:enhanced serine sensitivity protein SseB [Escherichia coli]|nr:enhanced serine sensitivity protein SseB [Escherichia coli]
MKIARLIYSTGKKEDGTSVIPFFTSLEALQQAVEDEQAFVVMPVRTLFEMTLGETLFLNAKLPTGKEFIAAVKSVC